MAEDELGFFIDRQPNRELFYKNRWQNALTLEMSLNKKNYFRRVYSGLDFISDMGGLFSAIAPICKILLIIFNY